MEKLKPHSKMDKKIVKSEIEDWEFCRYKSPILINNKDINKIVVSKKVPFGEEDSKYFIGYKDNEEIRPLCIFFPEMSIYKRCSDKTKCMYFLIKDEKMFDKYMTISKKVNNIIKRD